MKFPLGLPSGRNEGGGVRGVNPPPQKKNVQESVQILEI